MSQAVFFDANAPVPMHVSDRLPDNLHELNREALELLHHAIGVALMKCGTPPSQAAVATPTRDFICEWWPPE